MRHAEVYIFATAKLRTDRSGTPHASQIPRTDLSRRLCCYEHSDVCPELRIVIRNRLRPCGCAGLCAGVLQPTPAEAPALVVGASYGYLLGIFPVNALHNLVHVVTGLIGVVSSRVSMSARLYSRFVAIIFGVLTIMGLVPGLNTTLGLIPLFGADVVLHALTMLAASYFGWFAGDAHWRAPALWRSAPDGGTYVQ